MTKSTGKMYEKHHKTSRGEKFSLFRKERGNFIRANIGIGKKILDIGCRDGALTSEFSKNNKVLGLDIDNHSLKMCRESLGIKTKNVDLNGDWGIKEKFDAVNAGEILEHLYYPEEVIKKIKNVLKKDGVFVGSVPNAFSITNRIRLFLGRKKGTPLQDPTHINHFKYSELKKILKKHFKNVKIIGFVDKKYHWLSKISPSYFSYMLVWKCKYPK